MIYVPWSPTRDRVASTIPNTQNASSNVWRLIITDQFAIPHQIIRDHPRHYPDSLNHSLLTNWQFIYGESINWPPWSNQYGLKCVSNESQSVSRRDPTGLPREYEVRADRDSGPARRHSGTRQDNPTSRQELCIRLSRCFRFVWSMIHQIVLHGSRISIGSNLYTLINPWELILTTIINISNSSFPGELRLPNVKTSSFGFFKLLRSSLDRMSLQCSSGTGREVGVIRCGQTNIGSDFSTKVVKAYDRPFPSQIWGERARNIFERNK
jgi:hypothetical protein